MAVVIKEHGFKNIKIYNGGLKDWIKSGHPVNSTEPLPDYETPFISADAVHDILHKVEQTGCLDNNGQPLLTLVDFRTSTNMKKKIGGESYRVKTSCRTISRQLDEFVVNRQLIDSIPKKGLVVTISETGNRDTFLIRYLFKYGYTNVKGLEFGMRGWIISEYPIEKFPVVSKVEETGK